MIDLSLLPDGGIGWLDASGPKASIVLSTRIRLARNLHGHVFSQRAGDADRTAVLTRVAEAGGAGDPPGGAGTIPPGEGARGRPAPPPPPGPGGQEAGGGGPPGPARGGGGGRRWG